MNLIDIAKKYYAGFIILTDWIGTGGHTVPREAAQARANVCLKCPHSATTLLFSGASAEAMKVALEIKKSAELRVEGEKSLGSCDICLCKINLKVWVPIFHILAGSNEEEISKFPAECWIKTEKTQLN